MSRVCVLGMFGYASNQLDGQTIKTRNVYTLLQDKNVDVDFFDTQDFKKSKFSFLRMCKKVMSCKTLCYLPAHNNLTYLFPLIYWLSGLFHTQVHYFVVGGWLVEYLEGKPRHRRKLSRIAGIHCETQLMKTRLEHEYGFNNVDVFPNFRISSFIPTRHHENGKLKLVFMARIVKMKGIDTIFALCERIIEKGLGGITIDFYGQYDDDSESDIVTYFNSNLQKYDFAEYHGAADPANINSILEKYDAMLLPTHYYTEGLPGSILDAYMSGIPVIVTKWKHATEFVEEGKTGIIIPFDDNGTALFEAVLTLFSDKKKLDNMKTASFEKAYEFSSEKAWTLMDKYLHNN